MGLTQRVQLIDRVPLLSQHLSHKVAVCLCDQAVVALRVVPKRIVEFKPRLRVRLSYASLYMQPQTGKSRCGTRWSERLCSLLPKGPLAGAFRPWVPIQRRVLLARIQSPVRLYPDLAGFFALSAPMATSRTDARQLPAGASHHQGEGLLSEVASPHQSLGVQSGMTPFPSSQANANRCSSAQLYQ
jgi:hypothetical protein